jgi:hypothetical protein
MLEAALGERRDLIRQAEVDVRGGKVVAPANAFERFAEGVDHAPAIGARSAEKARARGGGKRYPDQQLRVVGDACALRRLRPTMVEHELAHAVCLDVEGTGPDQLATTPQRQVLGQPAGPSGNAPRILERSEPLPFEEGRAVADERVPRLGADIRDPFLHFQAHVPTVGFCAIERKGPIRAA